MAMFLSRIKQVLNLGTKSITSNGTYNASSDGYDGYSQVSVNMPSVTPSNASPAALTSGNAVTPTANGYAIESYDSLTPSDNPPASITGGRIYKAGTYGFAIQNMYSAHPSDSSPAELITTRIYKPAENGYFYETIQPSPTDITPSNSSPVALTANTPVNPTASGYAISSYSSKTPSDSSPASVSSGAIIKASSSGYLYSSSGLGQYVNITNTASKDETFNLSSGSTTSISVTSKPKLILWFQGNYGSAVAAGYGEMGMYDGIRNKYRRVTYYSSGGNTATDSGDITSVTSSSVSFKNNGSTYRRYHVMMWY